MGNRAVEDIFEPLNSLLRDQYELQFSQQSLTKFKNISLQMLNKLKLPVSISSKDNIYRASLQDSSAPNISLSLSEGNYIYFSSYV